ncbi:MAG: hypothetical protein ABSA58_19430 [Acetobacteraceae bacterium]|jgi:hypothetical protein
MQHIPASWSAPVLQALRAAPNNKRVEGRVLLLVFTGLDPVISRGNVLEQITGSSPVMTNGGEPG